MTRKSKSKQPFDQALAIEQLAELGVQRNQFIKAKNRVMNAAGAFVRRALGWRADMPEAEGAQVKSRAAKILGCNDYTTLTAELEEIANIIAPHIETFRKMSEPAEHHVHEIEKEMRKVARQFPIWTDWALEINGLSDLGMAVIIAEAGDLAKYSTHSKLWKRLGLAPFEKGGETQSYSMWARKGGLTADEWIGAGYSPKRRAAKEGHKSCDSPQIESAHGRGVGHWCRADRPTRSRRHQNCRCAARCRSGQE
jgi:hypothetical protein